MKEEKHGKAELLGEPGAFGKVKIIENVVTGERKALKVLHNKHKTYSAREEFENEAKVLKLLNRGSSIVLEKKYAPKDKKNKSSHPAIIMDIVPGERLFEVLKAKKLKPLERINIFLDILLEADNLHKKLNLIHTDIKAENIIYGLIAQLIDFGKAGKIGTQISFDRTPGIAPSDQSFFKGTPDFDIFAIARLARDIFGFYYRDHRYEDVDFGDLDPKAPSDFEANDRARLFNLVIDMEKTPRITLQNAIDRMRAFKFTWLKNHGSTEEIRLTLEKSLIGLADQLSAYSKQEVSKITRRTIAKQLADELRLHAGILRNPNVNLEQHVASATQILLSVRTTMWRLFQKTEPGAIQRGFFSTRRKGKTDLSVSDIFSRCPLAQWEFLKNTLDEKFQATKPKLSIVPGKSMLA